MAAGAPSASSLALQEAKAQLAAVVKAQQEQAELMRQILSQGGALTAGGGTVPRGAHHPAAPQPLPLSPGARTHGSALATARQQWGDPDASLNALLTEAVKIRLQQRAPSRQPSAQPPPPRPSATDAGASDPGPPDDASASAWELVAAGAASLSSDGAGSHGRPGLTPPQQQQPPEAEAGGGAALRSVFRAPHNDEDVPEGEYEVYDADADEEQDGVYYGYLGDEGAAGGGLELLDVPAAAAAESRGQEGPPGAGEQAGEGGGAAPPRLYPQGLAAGDEEVFEEVLQLRLQLHDLDAENVALRRQLEQQRALLAQLQTSLLMASTPPAAATAATTDGGEQEAEQRQEEGAASPAAPDGAAGSSQSAAAPAQPLDSGADPWLGFDALAARPLAPSSAAPPAPVALPPPPPTLPPAPPAPLRQQPFTLGPDVDILEGLGLSSTAAPHPPQHPPQRTTPPRPPPLQTVAAAPPPASPASVLQREDSDGAVAALMAVEEYERNEQAARSRAQAASPSSLTSSSTPPHPRLGAPALGVPAAAAPPSPFLQRSPGGVPPPYQHPAPVPPWLLPQPPSGWPSVTAGATATWAASGTPPSGGSPPNSHRSPLLPGSSQSSSSAALFPAPPPPSHPLVVPPQAPNAAAAWAPLPYSPTPAQQPQRPDGGGLGTAGAGGNRSWGRVSGLLGGLGSPGTSGRPGSTPLLSASGGSGRSVGAAPVDDTPWACAACTYEHAGREARFLRCAVCNALR